MVVIDTNVVVSANLSDEGLPARILSAAGQNSRIAQSRCAMLREGPVMSNAATPSYLEIIDFIAAGTTPQAVVDYHPSAEARACVAALIAREKEGALAPDEKAELDGYVNIANVLSVMHSQARVALRKSGLEPLRDTRNS